MRFAPSEFWSMTLKEANLAIRGDKARQENGMLIQYYAHMNALGGSLGGNKFKFINPFKDDKNKKPKEATQEELKTQLDDLINNWR